MSDTTYPVKLIYTLQDGASGGLRSISGAAKDAAHTTDMLSGTLSHLAGLAAGAFGLHKAKEVFVDFNAEMETMKIQASTMLFGNELAASWDAAATSADSMLTEFQRFAITSPVTTKEIMGFSNGISVAVAQAGGGIKEIVNFAEQGVIAAKALGANADYAALELTEGIQKGMTARQRFLKQLVATQHIDEKDFNAMSAVQRMDVLGKALNSPAMKAAAKAFGESFEGVTSTLEDTLQILAGRAGKDFFGMVTAEIKSWNEWLDKNKAKVDEIRTAVSHGLVEAFGAVKSAVSFMVDHASEIKLLVEALLVLKGVGIVGGAISSGISTFSSSIATLGSTATMASAGLGGVVGAATNVVSSLGALYIGLSALAEMIDAEHKREVGQEGDKLAIYDAMMKAPTRQVARDVAITKAKQFGAIGPNGELNQDKLYAGLFSLGYRQQDKETNDLVSWFKQAWDPEEAARRAGLTHTVAKAAEEKRPEEKKKSPTTVNIHVARVEVRSDDPDRFAIGLVDMGRRAMARPTQALTAPRL